MTRLAALHARITGDASGFVKAAQQAEDAAQDAAAAMGGTGAGGARGGGLSGAAGRASGAFKSFASSPGMRMLPVQLSQVAQQAAAGTGVLRALTIQAADIGLAFGAVGAVVGTVATIAMPAIIAAFSDASDEAGLLEDTLEGIDDLRSDLERTLDILSMSALELAENFGTAAQAVKQAAINMAQLQLAQAEARLRDQIEAAQIAGKEYSILAAQLDGYARANVRLKNIAKEFGLESSAAARRFVEALDELNKATTFEDMRREASELQALMAELGVDVNDLPEDFRLMLIELNKAEIAGAELEKVMQMVADAVSRARSEAEGFGSTFGTAFGSLLSGEDLLPTTEELGEPDKPTRRGGLSERDKQEKELEALRQKLMSELEVEQEMHDQRGEMLRAALEAELLTQQEYDALMEAEKKRHADAMTALDVWKYGTQLDQAEAFFGQMATAFATGNERMMQIAKVFGAAETLINSWRTFSQVMADPSLPWFAKLPAAISLFGSAVQAVSAIQGVGKGGSGKKAVGAGGGGGGGETIPAGEAASPKMQRSLTLIGDRFNRAQAIEIAEFMNEGTDDGLVIRGRR